MAIPLPSVAIMDCCINYFQRYCKFKITQSSTYEIFKQSNRAPNDCLIFYLLPTF